MKWSFDPEASSDQFKDLPLAKSVLITFPLTGEGQSEKVVKGYEKEVSRRKEGSGVRFVQLGSTGIWQIPQPSHWTDRKSPYNQENSRAVAEDELLDLGGCVLNLAGLWGGSRNPRDFVDRVAKSKEDVRGKKSLHMVHGQDVSRAILAVLDDAHWEEHGRGERWMLTDGFVYDWWSLFVGWADAASGDSGEEVDREPSKFAKWVFELMGEEDVAALPRSMEALGRCYDSREFWKTFGVVPLRARI